MLTLSPWFAPGYSPNLASDRIRQIRFNLTITNPTAHSIINQKLWFLLPRDIPGKQALTAVSTSWPSQQLENDTGQNRLRLDFNEFPAFAIKTISISAQIAMSATVATQPLERPELWLKAERHIEVTDPGIQQQAQALKAVTPKESAYRIYAWVSSHLHYRGYMPENQGAAYALQHQGGDCTEYATLVVALARANGIPARMASGYVLTQDAVVKATDYHDWAELYIDGKWQLVDAQKGHWLTPSEHYITFQIYGLENPNQSDGFNGRFQLADELKLSY